MSNIDKSLIVNSVSSFLCIMKTLTTSLERKEMAIFFRGQNHEYKAISPFLYRPETKYAENEWEIYHEAIYSSMIDFSDCHSTLEELSKMQHYGIPTRLLDLTTNPLVALFFACHNYKDIEDGRIEKKNKSMNCKLNASIEIKCTTEGEKGVKYPTEDPVVYIFTVAKDKVKGFDSDSVTVLTNLAKFDPTYKKNLTYRYKPWKTRSACKELISKIKIERPAFKNKIDKKTLFSTYFVYAKRNNPLIIKQSGAFAIFGMNKGYNERNFWDIDSKYPNFTLQTIYIDKNYTNRIIEELKMLNITELSLGLGNCTLTNHFKQKYEK